MAKSVINSTLTFTPASKTIDFANVQAFDLRDVYAIVNITAGKIIYAPGITGKGYTNLTGTVLTLQYDTTAMSASDVLAVQYDDYMLQSGVYNATLPTVTSGQKVVCQTDSRGRQIVVAAPTDGVLATYSAAISGLAVANNPTDIFTITGSASKTVKITRIALTATQTTAAQRDILFIKRSTANTGGTTATATATPHDSTSAAATAVVRSYTVNPTAVGTTVGNVRTRKALVSTATGNSDEIILTFGDRPSQALILRGVNESVAINLNAVTSAGNLFSISVEWTEE